MKRNNVIIGSVGIVAIAALFAVSPWKSNDSVGAYTQESFTSLTVKSADDARLWLEAKYIDPETGERISDKKLRQIDAAVLNIPKSRAVSFVEQGPDNIGGRTRAIQVDKQNGNIIYAGGVSGGLFKSLNSANLWTRVDAYETQCSPFISSMAQFSNGTLFVSTGSNQEGWGGNGVWYTQDGGDTWTVVPGTSTISNITEVVAPTGGTTLWLATTSGLKKWGFGDATLTSVTTSSGGCSALAASPNGQVMVAAIGSNKVFVSTDYGVTFMDKSGTGTGSVPSGSGRYEFAVSPTLNSSGNYSTYVVRTGSNLVGMHVSHDSGNTWSQFVGSSGTPSNLDIYRNQGTYNSIVSVTPQNPEKILIGGIDIWKWQQTTNTPPSGGFEKLTQWFLQPTSPKYAHADNHEMKWSGNKLYLGNDGGIGITYNPEEEWFPANRGYNVTQFYGIAFDKNGAVMGGAQDNGTVYNDHQLSTFKEFKEVSGGDGFQCEISFFNPKVLFTTSQFGSGMRSTDGGQTIESFLPDVPSSYDPFGTDGSSYHPFHTNIFLAEYYDVNSRDSVVYTPNQNHLAGSTIMVPSKTTSDSMEFVLPYALYYSDTLDYTSSLSMTETSVVNGISGQTIYLGLYSWVHHGTAGSGLIPPIVGDSILVDFETGTDTVVVESVGSYIHYYSQNTLSPDIYDMGIDSVLYGVAWNRVTVQDPYQSWFLMYVNANSGELWGTRNSLRLSTQDMQWGVIVRGIGGSGGDMDVEFSRDLNRLYITTGGSTVTRVDGLRDVYTSDSTFMADAFWHEEGAPSVTTAPNGTAKLTFSPGGSIEGIAVNPSDENDLVVVTGVGSNNIKRSMNAAGPSPTFTNVGSIAGSNSPATYDAIIDRDNPNIIVVGTSSGVFVTENGGTSWTNGSAGFFGTPVYEVRQSWRTWSEGNFRPGEIYLGTYGRGIWSSSSYLSTPDMSNNGNNGTSIEDFKTNLFPYPNPTSASTSLSFELANASDVTIQVYNLSGRLVKTITKKHMSQGSQVVDIDGADLGSGTYVVKMVAGKQLATTKFVKM